MSKLGLLAAGAAGYVLGARAGHERYEQIAGLAKRVWTSPTVQRAATQAQERAKEAAPIVVDKVGEAAKHAADAAVSAVKRDGDDGSSGTDRAPTNGRTNGTTVSHV